MARGVDGTAGSSHSSAEREPQIRVGQGYPMIRATSKLHLQTTVARIAMKYDQIVPSPESNNEKRNWVTGFNDAWDLDNGPVSR